MRYRRLLACALFTTLAISTAPTLAQNLSHCDDMDPGEIWCASLTVEEDSGLFGYDPDGTYGFGSLSSGSFEYDGTFYSVIGFYYDSLDTPPRFIFILNNNIGGQTGDQLNAALDGQSDLKLTLGTVELSFPTGTFDTDKGEYAWENPGLSWSDGDVVPVRLVRILTAPTASNGTVTTNEDTDYAFAASDFNFADTAGDELESVKIVTLPASGELQLNNAAIGSVPQTVTIAQLNASNFKYVPPANASGTGYTSFTFKVNDGELDSMADYTMTIDVTAVADTPACAPPTLTNRRRVWQQTLTVGRYEAGGLNELVGYGWFRDTGTLSGRSAPIDLGTNRYRIGELVMRFAQTGDLVSLLTAPPGALVFHLVGETNPDAELTATEKAGLTLHVCGEAFTFASAKRPGSVTTLPAGSGQDRHYIWENSGLTWSDGLVRTLTLSMPTSMQVAVDPPEVDGTPQVSGEGEDGSWSAGESVEVTLSFSEAVAVNTSGGTPSLEIRLGGTAAHSAEYLSGSGTSELVFGYTLGKNESSYTSVSVTPNSLALNGGTIRSAETQVAALLAHNGTVVQGSSTRNTRDTRNEVPVSPTALKATFSNPPKHHDGSSKFVVDLTFSKEPVGLSYQTVGGSLLDVTGGSVVEARRLTPGSNTDWRVTIRPSVQGDLTITLPVRACTETNAVCVDGEALASSASITVPGPETYTEEPVPETLGPITASWVQPPEEHDGSTAFDLHLKFSHEPVGFSYQSIAGVVVNVQGGTITHVWRWVEGRNSEWGVQVTPSGTGDVTADVNGTGQCSEDHAVCDAVGRKLEAGAEVRVKGPAMLSVADKPVASVSGLALSVPNPFNSSTQIAYHLSNPGPVQLVIYNVLGQSVRTLVDQFQAAGSHRVQWDARGEQGASLSSGVYIIRLSYPGRMETQRLLYLK